MTSSKSLQNILRKHFPTVYLTLISILVALAVEGLLERINELPQLFAMSPSAILYWLEISIVLSIAALFWWVIARWVFTFPWVFGFFDALAPLILLMVLHFLAQSVGATPDRWFAALGVVAIGGAVNYVVSAWRALAFTSRAGARWKVVYPAAIPATVGLLAVLGSSVGFGSISTGFKIFVNALVVGVVIAFSAAEYRFWARVVAEHLDESPAA
jgi:hypothetical protein